MSAITFGQMLEEQWAKNNFVCVGLDSEFGRMPESVEFEGGWRKNYIEAVVDFNAKIVEATKDLACAYKPNAAFYEANGPEGMRALRHTIENIHLAAPDVPVILDAKRADIGNTNAGYVKSAFEYFGADAVTVHPYLGKEALQPFLDQKDKGVIVLCRTSNPGAGEFQDVQFGVVREEGEFLQQKCGGCRPFDSNVGYLARLYEHVAYQVSQRWNANGNCALVVGATYPGELATVRAIAGDMPILIPGIGAQGGDVEKTVKAGKDSRGQGMIVNSSRGIIFASNGADFAEAARRETEKLHNLINQYR